MFKAVFIIKFFIFFLFLSSCTEIVKQDFPIRDEILWTYNVQQNAFRNLRYNILYNHNGKIIKSSNNSYIFLYTNELNDRVVSCINFFDAKGNFLWKNTYYSEESIFNIGYDILSAENKTIIVAGQQDNGGWLFKLDSVGDIIWEKTWESQVKNLFTSIELAPNGNYLIAGISYLDSNNNILGDSDIWLVEVSIDGEIIWETKYGKRGYDEFIYDIMFIDSNRFAAVGYEASTNPKTETYTPTLNATVYIFEKHGNILKSKSIGGDGFDIFYALAIDTEGNIICIGQTESTTGALKSNGLADALVVKFDASLDITWAKNFGGKYNDFANSVTITNNNEIIFIGSTQSNDNDVKNKLLSSSDPWRMYDAWLVKINQDGLIIWDMCYGGSANDYGRVLTDIYNENTVILLESLSQDGDINWCNRGFWLAGINIEKLDKLYSR